MRSLTPYFLSALMLSCFPVFSQKAVRASGTYLMRVENNMTWDDAKSKATLHAQINAIESVFGKVIAQENSSYISNNQTGAEIKTNTSFNFISNSYVKGEWVEDLADPEVTRVMQGSETWIKATVVGKVRELTVQEKVFETATLTCPDIKCNASRFNDGQDLFVYFKSPEDGYVSIYLTDPELKYTFLLLPYKNSTIKKCVPIKADKAYVFFSKANDYFNEAKNIDEQMVSAPSGINSGKYQLWILFSPEPIEKPALEDETITTRKFLDENSIKQGYTLQKGMEDATFTEWLQRYRVHDKKIQLAALFFDVNKK